MTVEAVQGEEYSVGFFSNGPLKGITKNQPEPNLSQDWKLEIPSKFQSSANSIEIRKAQSLQLKNKLLQ